MHILRCASCTRFLRCDPRKLYPMHARVARSTTVCLVCTLCLCAVVGTAAAKRQSGKQTFTVQQGATDVTPEERGLTDPEQLTAATLAQAGRQWHKDVVSRRFKGPVLGYVTPWNAAGYNAAVRWRARFTHISPVWYQLRLDQEGALVLVGGHDVDAGWLARLRAPTGLDCEGDGSNQTCSSSSADAAAGGAAPRVVPRVVVELPSLDKVALLLTRPGPAIERLVQEVNKHGFDGLVLEVWALLGHLLPTNQGLADALRGFVRQLAANLQDAGDKELILAVLPVLPAPGRAGASPQQLLALLPELAGASLMTYDFSSQQAGPNAPLPWVADNVAALQKAAGDAWPSLAPRVWLGLNFYGWDYSRASAGAQPQVADMKGPAFVELLEGRQPGLRWDSKAAEHYIKYKAGDSRHQVWYPTPASMAARIQLAQEAGCGLAIWELGQGLESFFDLL